MKHCKLNLNEKKLKLQRNINAEKTKNETKKARS